MVIQHANLDPLLCATWLIFCDDKLIVHRESKKLPSCAWQSLKIAHQAPSEAFSLVSEHNVPFYVLDMGSELSSQAIEQRGWDTVSLRGLLLHSPAEDFELLSRAWQFVHFRRTHRYCGQCGSEMKQDHKEMAMQCHHCGHRCYPRISPCIIVAIRKGDKMLLAQGRAHQSRNMYSTLAGFVESGENLEQAVAREVMEEVGIKVTRLEYFGSQPWPFPHSLMIGFLAEYADGEICIDDEEIIDAQWYEIDQLPMVPPTFSIAGQLIKETIKRIRAEKA